MSTVCAGTRVVAGWVVPCLVALALFATVAVPFTAADETSPPPPATTTTGNDPAPKAQASPIPGSPTPAPAAMTDSVVAPQAVPDSSAKAPDAADAKADAAKSEAKEEASEEAENAAAAPEQKPLDGALIPSATAKPIEEPAIKTTKASTPKAGGATLKSRSRARNAKGTSKTRTLAKPLASKAPSKPHRNAGTPHDFAEGDRVVGELERTERFVNRAQRSILLSKNPRAMKLYASAVDFQSDSREACKVRQYARAERLTLAARDFADRATRMVGPPREDPDHVEHVLRRTDDAIERAKDVLKTGASRYAWRRHEDLKAEQKDAWGIFKKGDVGGAYKQTLGVREGILVLLRQLQDLPVPREAAEKAIGGAQAALEHANRELGPRPNGEAARLVRLANEYLAKARQSFQRGSYRSALLQAKVVERHVEHAVDVGRPRSG